MRVAVTGTPGTGKTSAVDRLETDLEVVHLNEVIEEHDFTIGYDDDRRTTVADLDAISKWLAERSDVVFESHLAHEFPADSVVVLRCHPDELESRLSERGEEPEKIVENAESEALDLVLADAVSAHGADNVYEIDTTDRTIVAVSEDIAAVIADDRDPSAGEVSFIDYFDA